LPLGALVLALLIQPAYAHGFGGRYVLPIPLSFFVVGGAATVMISFLIIGVLVNREALVQGYPRLNLLRYTWFRWLARPPLLLLVKLVSLFLFLLVIATGLFGVDRPVDNLAPTFIWIIWWVGLGFFVALFGNLWALVNPWKILYSWFEFIYHQFQPDRELTLGYDYPQRWGVWPAVILFFSFSWAEVALAESADPETLARMMITYSIITLGGMFIFGKHQWLRHGEAFTVVFGLLTRFSLSEVRVTEPEVCRECGTQCLEEGGECIDCYECFEYAEHREFNLRPPAIGLNQAGTVTPSMVALAMLLLATVTFDGFSATPEWVEVQSFFINLFPYLTSPYLNGVVIANTVGLLGFPLGFALVYWMFSGLIYLAVGRRPPLVGVVMAAFAFTLIPIALVYNYAHFLTFLVIQGQLIIALASDPFGVNWNLFGTRDYLINIEIFSASFVWFFSVGVIVLGHVIAVLLAHLRAMQLYNDHNLALKSQLPMLGLMVLYTVVSLWIVSRPITE
ncbi:MAG: hypothetical protein ACE5Q6_16045, partial [Dehalococcoidia bacterium]